MFSNAGYGRVTRNISCEQVPTAGLHAFSYSTANCWHAAGFILSSIPSKALTCLDPHGENGLGVGIPHAANPGILVHVEWCIHTFEGLVRRNYSC